MRTAERINDPEKTIVDGLRNIEELEFFKRHYDSVIVVAIYANRQERLNRILKRTEFTFNAPFMKQSVLCILTNILQVRQIKYFNSFIISTRKAKVQWI